MKPIANVGTVANAAPARSSSHVASRRITRTTLPATAATSSTVAVVMSDADGVMVSSGYEPRLVARGPNRTTGARRSKPMASGRR